MIPEEILRVRGLDVDLVRHGADVPVLRDVNLTIRRGEVHALVGPSGSGKSTLASLVTGVWPTGSIRIGRGTVRILAGEAWIDPTGRSSVERRLVTDHVKWIPQEPAIAWDPVRTMQVQLAEPLGTDTSRLHQILTVLGLGPEEIGTRFPWQLSGGQQQRCLLAQAMAARPVLLVADEPTASLDQHLVRTFLEQIRDWVRASDGPGVLLISHDERLVESLADRISFMREGRVIPDGKIGGIGLSGCGAVPVPEDGDPMGGVGFQGSTRSKEPKDVLLEVSGLSGGHVPGQPVLTDVSFVLHSGEVLGVAGPSGSGKSSILRGLMERLPWQTGTIRGRNGLPVRPGACQPVYQDPGRTLNPVMTIGETLSEWIGVLPVDRRPGLLEVIGRGDLPEDVLLRKPHMLSGGQKQRLAILRALIPEPDVLLADEPFSSLDVDTRDPLAHWMTGLLRDQARGMVLVSHDLQHLTKVCDRIMVIHQGQVYWCGEPASLVSQSDPWLHTLLGGKGEATN